MQRIQTKKLAVAVGAALAIYTGGVLPAGSLDGQVAATAPLAGLAVAEAAEEAWIDDINEATRDDTMAFGVYVGKPMQAFIDDFKSKGWTRKDIGNAVGFMKRKGDYIISLIAHPHGETKNLVGDYRIRFYAKTREMADEMYMMAEKNFAYNFGRPSVKKGTNNMTWFLNDSFSIIVEYNEYDPRLPLVKDYYPYEIVIKREMGDFRKFFQNGQ